MKTIILKLWELVKKYQSDIALALTIIMITIISFNLGKISILQGRGEITNDAKIESSPTATKTKPTNKIAPKAIPTPDYSNTEVITSKSSKSKVFHFPWCSGYKTIADKNRIKFPNSAAAIAAGYTQAANCK